MYDGISNLTCKKMSMTTKKMKNQAVRCRGRVFIFSESVIVMFAGMFQIVSDRSSQTAD